MAPRPRLSGPLANVRAAALALALAAAVGAAPLAGCDQPGPGGGGAAAPAEATTARVTINDRPFTLELALDQLTRVRGLGGRTSIDPDGGMLFVFPDQQAGVQAFLMRDCPIPIDIIYLDGVGRVLSWHEMKPEPPRGPGEGTPDDVFSPDPEAQARNARYEARLPRYSSRYPSQFVIELKGGTIPSLGLKEGQTVKFDAKGLKKRAR